MGQKVNPHGLRVGINKDWDSRWFAPKGSFAAYILEDSIVRKHLKKKLYLSGVPKIEIERSANKIKLNIYTAKPGMVIGKGGQGIEEIRLEIAKMTGKQVFVNIIEVRNAEKDAQLIAENIALSLERRVAFRRAMKQAMQRAMRAGVKGIKVSSSGRLGGAEIARTEGYAEGNVPLHTLRADIDYGFAEADTTYGKIGVKVWLCKGEILPTRSGPRRELEQAQNAAREDKRKPRRGSDQGRGRGGSSSYDRNRSGAAGGRPGQGRPQGAGYQGKPQQGAGRPQSSTGYQRKPQGQRPQSSARPQTSTPSPTHK